VTTPAPARLHPDRAVLLQDLRLAGVVAVLALIGFGVSLGEDFQFGLATPHSGSFLPGPRALLEVAAETVPLTFRRAAPLAVFTLVAVASLATQELNRRPEPLPLGVLVALYTVAVLRRPVVAVLAAAAYLVALAMSGLTGLTPVSDEQFYTDLIVVVGTMTLGYGITLGRTRARLAEQQAAEVTRAADSRTRDAVEQEKARIARDMHDILAHHLSLIVAQATAARRVAARRPEASTEALGSVESVGREALSALRRLVGLLRLDRDDPAADQPRLDRLGPLVAQVRSAGLPVQLAIRGEQRPLPAVVEASAFRIVQEGLTNSLRHGGRSRAEVTLTYRADVLEVEVRDEGGQAPDRVGAAGQADGAVADGYGLVGMRQRVALLGGQLVAGHDGTHGFRVAARLPLNGGPDPEEGGPGRGVGWDR
jgi:signal transduction histidine kinase